MDKDGRHQRVSQLSKETEGDSRTVSQLDAEYRYEEVVKKTMGMNTNRRNEGRRTTAATTTTHPTRRGTRANVIRNRYRKRRRRMLLCGRITKEFFVYVPYNNILLPTTWNPRMFK